MKRRLLLRLAAIGAFSGILAACTSFAPVYGDRADTGIQSARFNFAPPDSRLEQLIINRLKIAFPGEAGHEDPLLDIAAVSRSLPSSTSNAISVARPANVRVEATLTISQGDLVQFKVTRFTDTSYQSGKLTPVEIASSIGANESAARSTAESLRAAILAGYRPAQQGVVTADGHTLGPRE